MWRDQLEMGSEVMVRKESIDHWFRGRVMKAQGNLLKVQFKEDAVPVLKAVFRYSPDLRPLPPGAGPLSPRARPLSPRRLKRTKTAPLALAAAATPPSDSVAMQASVKVTADATVQTPAPRFTEPAARPVLRTSGVGARLRVAASARLALCDCATELVEAVVVDAAVGVAKIACFAADNKCIVRTVRYPTPPDLGLAPACGHELCLLAVGSNVWVRSARLGAWCRGVVTSIVGMAVKVVFWLGQRPCSKVLSADSAELWVPDSAPSSYDN